MALTVNDSKTVKQCKINLSSALAPYPALAPSATVFTSTGLPKGFRLLLGKKKSKQVKFRLCYKE